MNEFDQFLGRVSSGEFVAHTAAMLGHDAERIDDLVRTYANEARVGYSLVSPYLDKDKRYLEVGAGVGLLTAYLHLNGYDVTAIEPSGRGFDLNHAIGGQMHRWLDLQDLRFLDLGIEDVMESAHGRFDCIFSVNVVEHLPDLPLAFKRMAAVLSPDGIMVHTCPNYSIPYEPHFGIPLVPAFPQATERLLSNEIVNSGLWRSLNFVTASRVRKIARLNGLDLCFQPHVMYNAMLRMGEDPLFARRQGGFVRVIYSFLSRTGLLKALKLLPASWSTPMIFRCVGEGRSMLVGQCRES